MSLPSDEIPPPPPKLPQNEVAISKFNIFTLRANQRIYQEIIAKRNMDRQYIEALEAILLLNSIQLPERVDNSGPALPAPRPTTLGQIDGSAEQLHALLTKVTCFSLLVLCVFACVYLQHSLIYVQLLLMSYLLSLCLTSVYLSLSTFLCRRLRSCSACTPSRSVSRI